MATSHLLGAPLTSYPSLSGRRVYHESKCAARSLNHNSSLRSFHNRGEVKAPLNPLSQPPSRTAISSTFAAKWRPESIVKASTICRARNQDYSQEAKMREEVISPFRTVRMFLYPALVGSAGIGALVSLIRLVGLLAGAPGDGMDKTLNEDAIDLAVDVGAMALFGFLYRQDAKAKDAQLVKLEREETLSQLRLELASGRMVKVGQLRGASRLVIVAGPLSHIQKALALAEPLKEDLLARGVTVVPFVTEDDVGYKGGSGLSDYRAFCAAASSLVVEAEQAVPSGGETKDVSSKTEAELASRWIARPLYTNEWTEWLKEQLRFANLDNRSPVYLSLRLDGRVRGSGVGFPRWHVIAAQLPPMKGMWEGPFDGMDGRVL